MASPGSSTTNRSYGPISIVGTLSAAYPALTVIFAGAFLDERLTAAQYLGVVAVIAGCLALAYTPPEARVRQTQRRWMAYAGAAVVIWGVNGTGPASIVTPVSGAYPVVTLGFAWAVLRERPSILQWSGISLVLVGMVLTTASG
jgi:uncharacterized membrane protein